MLENLIAAAAERGDEAELFGALADAASDQAELFAAWARRLGATELWSGWTERLTATRAELLQLQSEHRRVD